MRTAVGFYYVEVYSFYIKLVESFYYESMLNFIKCLFGIYSDDRMIFSLHSVNVVYHIYWLAFAETQHPGTPGANPTAQAYPFRELLMGEGIVQVAECMFSTHEILGSIPGTSSQNKQINLITSSHQKGKKKDRKKFF